MRPLADLENQVMAAVASFRSPIGRQARRRILREQEARMQCPRKVLIALSLEVLGEFPTLESNSPIAWKPIIGRVAP